MSALVQILPFEGRFLPKNVLTSTLTFYLTDILFSQNRAGGGGGGGGITTTKCIFNLEIYSYNQQNKSKNVRRLQNVLCNARMFLQAQSVIFANVSILTIESCLFSCHFWKSRLNKMAHA